MGSLNFSLAPSSMYRHKFLPLSPAKRRPPPSPLSVLPARISAMRKRESDGGSGGSRRWGMVDENMIVLRKRIREIETVEQKYEPPAEWMDWEKRYYTTYSSVICDVMRMLQSRLMDTRPGVALGLAALVAFSVPTSSAVILLHLVEVVKGILQLGFTSSLIN
ncbi:uncharacterized protein LOC116198907 [Punica granatum]|uniref:Mediator of RNA polymerase II transcription subunit 18 n=2 Tax=Punica granatum TaxID=22663 RepID=A0A218WE58_PUNGR|nr:uncharacterized protein LOC116198907 [Punica granatum]OWM70342.1 hypothetical protein CDL15_Pgr004479 [Punica granatum]PKI61385.1 hypothetical protein CRG98_018233 [Punica granatum]